MGAQQADRSVGVRAMRAVAALDAFLRGDVAVRRVGGETVPVAQALGTNMASHIAAAVGAMLGERAWHARVSSGVARRLAPRAVGVACAADTATLVRVAGGAIG